VAVWALWSTAGVSPASFKWPNDIIVGDRKLAGILLERTEDLVVVGFGLNVESSPHLPDRATTCVREWRSGTFDVLRLFDDLQRLFASNLERWRIEGFSIFRRLWESEGPMVGAQMKVSLGNGMTVEGAYSGLADDGALKLVLASGREELVHAGDVEL
jgi:BirA family biotin operon repressor/biotin-[acetyl-CoA-carboxylase] ligase